MKIQWNQWIVCLLLCCGFIACSDDDEAQPTLLEVNTEAVMFAENAATKRVLVMAEREWTAEVFEEANWCTVSQTGNELEIAVTENAEVETRTAAIAVRSQGQEKQISVKQAGKEPSILVSLDGVQEGVELIGKGLILNGNVLTCRLKITATVDYEVVMEEYADWIKIAATGVRVAEEETTLTFELQPNETGESRRTEILLKQAEGDYYTYLSVVQQAK